MPSVSYLMKPSFEARMEPQKIYPVFLGLSFSLCEMGETISYSTLRDITRKRPGAGFGYESSIITRYYLIPSFRVMGGELSKWKNVARFLYLCKVTSLSYRAHSVPCCPLGCICFAPS